MPEGMLGDVSVKELHGPMMDLMAKVQGTNGRKWLEDFKKFLRKQFTILIGDGRTKGALLEAGRYDLVGVEAKAFIASAKFRWATKPDECDIELVEFDHDPPSSEYVLAEFKRRGLLEPTEEDALRFGEKYPDLQIEAPIVFLHSANLWLDPFGRRRVLVLFAGGSERRLDCFWFGDRWPRRYRFAARRPRKSTST